MSNRIALHTSINYINHPKYDLLSSCHESSALFGAISGALSFSERVILKEEEVTTTAVIEKLTHYAECLTAGDTFFFTFCGHGTEIEIAGQLEEMDNKDEALCFYDAPFLDNILFALICSFKPGVKVIVLLDACFSGGMCRNDFRALLNDEEFLERKRKYAKSAAFRNKEFSKVKASVSMIFSTQEGKFARSGKSLSWFAERIKVTIKSCQNYLEFTEKLNNQQFDQQVIKCMFMGQVHDWSQCKIQPSNF